MPWRRIGSSTAGQTSPPEERNYVIQTHTHRALAAGGTAFANWPFFGSIATWRKHLVGRTRVVTWVYVGGSKVETDPGWPTDPNFFSPNPWMTGGSSTFNPTGSHSGNTTYLETFDLCYPWQCVWRSRTRAISGGSYTYTTHTETVLPNSLYQFDFSAASGEIMEYFDAMILVPSPL